jgi:LmbE family N-acetylglucosaminyl deacetylase
VSRADAASEIFLLPSVIIAAHPDDEVLGLGGQLPRMNVTLVHVTDGAPMNLRDARAAGFATKEEYARARRLELLAAMSLAGIPEPRCIALNIGDQEASFRLGELTLRIAGLLQTLQPALVFTHPYEGGHPDHDASSFAVHSALKLLRPKQPEEPLLFEFTSYHAGPKGMETDFLPNSKSSIQQLRLGREECTLKLRMLDCFATQKHMVSQFPIEIEQVRPAPEYDFNEPPHPGTLFYEPFDWGIDGPGWRHMAAETERVLGI